MTLAEFLLARIAEDEDEVENAYGIECENVFSQERLRADYQAKRRIVALHTDNDVHECVPTMQVWPWLDTPVGAVPCPTLRLLALPYADHPDYRPEWKP